MPPKPSSRRPVPKSSVGTTSARQRQQQQQQQQEKGENSPAPGKPTTIPVDPSWYFLPTLPENIVGGSRAPHRKRMVSMHCKCPGMPMDCVLRVPPDATVSYVRERLALQHGGAVQHVELYRELIRDKIDERSVVRGAPTMTVREVWGLDFADHEPVQLPHLSAPNLNSTHLPHHFGGSMGTFASSHSFGGMGSVQASSTTASLRMPSGALSSSTSGGAAVSAQHGQHHGGHHNPSNPVLGSATRYSPESAAAAAASSQQNPQQQAPPLPPTGSPTSGGSGSSNSPHSGFPSPSHRRQASASRGAAREVTFDSSVGGGAAGNNNNNNNNTSRGSSRYNSPSASDRAGSTTTSQRRFANQNQQMQSKKVAMFANPDTVGHANYFVTMSTVPTSKTTAVGPTSSSGRRAISPSEQRHQEEALLHLEDDHVLCYYTFGAHDFHAPLLIGGVKNLHGALPPDAKHRVCIKQQFDRFMEKELPPMHGNHLHPAPKSSPSRREQRQLRRMRRLLDAGRKSAADEQQRHSRHRNVHELPGMDDDDDAAGDDSSSSESDAEVDPMAAKMQELVVESAADKAATLIAAGGGGGGGGSPVAVAAATSLSSPSAASQASNEEVK